MRESQANRLSHEHVIDIIHNGQEGRCDRLWHDLGTLDALVYHIT
jgi:hypothetical protein